MASAAKREKRLTGLQCNECGDQFDGWAWFVSIESEEAGTIGWNRDRGGTEGNTCPNCGSELIRYQNR